MTLPPDQKPLAREWWVDNRYFECMTNEYKPYQATQAITVEQPGYIRVIEYAAFERLQAELAEAKDEIRVAKFGWQQSRMDVSAALAEVEELKERHQIVSETSTLKQGTIQLLQDQRDQLKVEVERLKGEIGNWKEVVDMLRQALEGVRTPDVSVDPSSV